MNSNQRQLLILFQRFLTLLLSSGSEMHEWIQNEEHDELTVLAKSIKCLSVSI